MSQAASTAEWIGSGVLGISALLLVAMAAHLGASSAHADADAEFAAYRAERDRRMTPAGPAPAPEPWPDLLDILPIPTSPPAEAIPLQERTLQLHEVKAHRARHRKDPACS